MLKQGADCEGLRKRGGSGGGATQGIGDIFDGIVQPLDQLA